MTADEVIAMRPSFREQAERIFQSEEGREHWVETQLDRAKHQDSGCRCPLCHEAEAIMSGWVVAPPKSEGEISE